MPVLHFAGQGLADVGHEAWVGGAVKLEVISRCGQAQVAIDGAADYVGIAVVLAVILPPADGT